MDEKTPCLRPCVVAPQSWPRGVILSRKRRNAIGKHVGVYAGDNKVIHVWTSKSSCGDGANAQCADEKRRAKVMKTTIDEFANGEQVNAKSNSGLFPDSVVADRAEEFLNSGLPWQYNLLWNNCDHFVNWCHSGTFDSPQVRLIAWILISIAVILALIGIVLFLWFFVFRNRK